MSETTPAKHSEFSPSGSGRWLACPGSIPAIRSLNLKPSKSNFYAMEGTAAHEVGAMCLIDPTIKPEDLITENIEVEFEEKGRKGFEKFEVTREMANAVEEYVSHVLSYRTDTCKVRIEERVSLEFLTPGMFGTADAIIIDEDLLHVMDYKHGKGIPVEVKNNSQLQMYALGTVMGLIEEGFNINNIRKVVLHIIQPRCPHPDGPIRIDEITIDQLKKFSKRARKAIKNACSTDPWFEAGEKQCQWCDFAPMCKHLAEFNLRLAQKEFSNFKNLEDSFTEPNFKEANSLTEKEISIILENSKIIQNWISRMLAYAQSELTLGRDIPKFKLVRGRANRVFGDQTSYKDIMIIAMMENINLIENDFYITKQKSPAQVEKLLGKKKNIIQKYIEKPLGKVTIAHITDKRPALQPDLEAKNEFADFADEIPGE